MKKPSSIKKLWQSLSELWHSIKDQKKWPDIFNDNWAIKWLLAYFKKELSNLQAKEKIVKLLEDKWKTESYLQSLHKEHGEIFDTAVSEYHQSITGSHWERVKELENLFLLFEEIFKIEWNIHDLLSPWDKVCLNLRELWVSEENIQELILEIVPKLALHIITHRFRLGTLLSFMTISCWDKAIDSVLRRFMSRWKK